MCVFALGRSISSPSSSLFSAVGRPDIGFKFTAYFTPIFLLAVFVGSKYGVIGVALATSFIRVCGSVVSLNLSLSLIQLTLTDLYRTIRSNLSITLLLIVIIFSVLLGIGDSKRMYLVGAAPCILYFYFLLLRILFPLDLRSFFRELERYIPIKSVHKVIQGIFFFKTEFEIK
jgi:hypothetical protein